MDGGSLTEEVISPFVIRIDTSEAEDALDRLREKAEKTLEVLRDVAKAKADI